MSPVVADCSTPSRSLARVDDDGDRGPEGTFSSPAPFLSALAASAHKVIALLQVGASSSRASSWPCRTPRLVSTI